MSRFGSVQIGLGSASQGTVHYFPRAAPVRLGIWPGGKMGQSPSVLVGDRTMGFKEQVAIDASTFLNPLEFGEEYSVSMGGVTKSVVAVLDDDSQGEASSEGVVLLTKRFHCRAGDLPRAPVRGKVILISGTAYLVDDISSEMGMMALTLSVHDSGGG